MAFSCRDKAPGAACWIQIGSLLFIVSGCSGIQSALDPTGVEAERIATLFWVMTGGAVAIWLAVVTILLYALRRRRQIYSDKAASSLIFWAGAVFPTVTLLVLLGYALWLMPGLRPFAQAAKSTLMIEVTGKQFWWQVVYRPAGGPPVVSANEIRLPLSQRVELSLKSDDVIHSFWIPSLGGKMDMLPGRTNRLSLQATKAGIYRGPCAEYCGTSHARMAFSVITMPTAEFERWLAGQAMPSARTADEGSGLFVKSGCGACHTVNGTEAQGTIGPDLSHLGSRQTVAAGVLANSEESIARFIARPDAIKPGSKMPSFDMLPPDEIRAIAAWLKGLE
jgi:cytochrome c oxidase subunit 2